MCVLSYVQLFVTPWASNPPGSSAAAKSLQLCLPLCDPIDGSPRGSPVPRILLLQSRKVKSESEVVESCPTLSDPMDCGPPGSSIHGIFQARVLDTIEQLHSHNKSLPHEYIFMKLYSHKSSVNQLIWQCMSCQ